MTDETPGETPAKPVPKIAAMKPKPVTLEKGKTYYFCTCGHSDNQPFCDGAHKGTGFKSHPFTAGKDGEHWLCYCKHTAKTPFCDGTHNRIQPAS